MQPPPGTSSTETDASYGHQEHPFGLQASETRAMLTIGCEAVSPEFQSSCTNDDALKMGGQATKLPSSIPQKKSLMICKKRRGIFVRTWKDLIQAHDIKRRDIAAALVRREGLSSNYKPLLELAPSVELNARMRLGARKATDRFLNSLKKLKPRDAAERRLRKNVHRDNVKDLTLKMAATEIDAATFRRIHVDELTSKIAATKMEAST